jgi:hypothetical protein
VGGGGGAPPETKFLRYEEQQERRREKAMEQTADFRDFRRSENKEKVSRKRKGEVRKSLEKRKTLETE